MEEIKKTKPNSLFVPVAHWPFRLGLAATAFVFALTLMVGPTARRIVVLLSFVSARVCVCVCVCLSVRVLGC